MEYTQMQNNYDDDAYNNEYNNGYMDNGYMGQYPSYTNSYANPYTFPFNPLAINNNSNISNPYYMQQQQATAQNPQTHQINTFNNVNNVQSLANQNYVPQQQLFNNNHVTNYSIHGHQQQQQLVSDNKYDINTFNNNSNNNNTINNIPQTDENQEGTTNLITKSENIINNGHNEGKNQATPTSTPTPTPSPSIGSSNNSSDNEQSLLILLDWDDTLFPTTMINNILHNRDNNDMALIRDDEIDKLNKLGHTTLLLLNNLIYKYGINNIHIITNSLNGWIQESLKYAACIASIYKDIALLLISNNITMISAQSKYSSILNSTPTMWKRLCFDKVISSTNKHILSIGDQWTDHYAVKHSLQNLKYDKYSIHHVIKLKMNPNVDDMLAQILYIHQCFAQIFDGIITNNNNKSVLIKPIIIDYEKEELKYYYKKITTCNNTAPINPINVNVNVNMNLNVNVNLVNGHDNNIPKQYMK